MPWRNEEGRAYDGVCECARERECTRGKERVKGLEEVGSRGGRMVGGEERTTGDA